MTQTRRIAVDTDAAVEERKAPRPIDTDLRIVVDSDAAVEEGKAPRPIDTDLRSPAGSLRIAVDFDGVLFDHVPYLLRGFRDAHGIDLEEEGFQYWDFFQYRAVREKNLTWQCVKNVLTAIDTDVAIHELPPRDPYARDVMGGWMEEGHQVYVVTARSEESRATTELFLERHKIPHDGLVMSAARKTGYDLLVDDAPHNVLMAAADGGRALLMDHPYNRDVPTRTNPVRVFDWHGVERAASARDVRDVLPVRAR